MSPWNCQRLACHSAVCHSAVCHSAVCHSAGCHSAGCHQCVAEQYVITALCQSLRPFYAPFPLLSITCPVRILFYPPSSPLPPLLFPPPSLSFLFISLPLPPPYLSILTSTSFSSRPSTTCWRLSQNARYVAIVLFYHLATSSQYHSSSPPSPLPPPSSSPPPPKSHGCQVLSLLHQRKVCGVLCVEKTMDRQAIQQHTLSSPHRTEPPPALSLATNQFSPRILFHG